MLEKNAQRYFSDQMLEDILYAKDNKLTEELFKRAYETRFRFFSNKVYVRALIEFSNFCSQGCYYCGINRSLNIKRYRLSKDEIIKSATIAHNLGFRTFVLQSGEDYKNSEEFIVGIIHKLKTLFPDSAVTLSLGVYPKQSYLNFKRAKADRYLLRFETSNEKTFKLLHPSDQSLKERLSALEDLKSVGFQVGTGFLVQAPFTTIEDHINDIKLIRKIKPQMIGIGPFIAHHLTEFSKFKAGDFDLTLKILAILRIEHPHALIPATTALNTINKDGRISGFKAGCNVIMPNVTPEEEKKNYLLYDNKASINLESLNNLHMLSDSFEKNGFYIDFSRGDYKGETDG